MGSLQDCGFFIDRLVVTDENEMLNSLTGLPFFQVCFELLDADTSIRTLAGQAQDPVELVRLHPGDLGHCRKLPLLRNVLHWVVDHRVHFRPVL